MFKLIFSLFKRITTAVTSPFRKLLTSFMRLFNVNIWTAKIIKPLTKFVKQALNLKPKSKEEYYTVGRFLVFKKVFLVIVIVACAGIFLYFTMFADPVQTSPTVATPAVTSENFDFDDMAVKDYTGVANIISSTGEVVYTGNIESGVVQGTGTLHNRDGIKVYEGEFAENKYEGMGVKYFENGAQQYVGQFSNNLYHGEGNMYYADGVLQYSGMFANGEFAGEGELYNQEGTLLYTGNFLGGDYHGTGISYFPDGTKRYEGEFFEGQAQGIGTLFTNTGKLIYTGAMYNGNIDYRALLDSNLEEIEAAFTETPQIVYSNSDSVFVYELAGVILTLDAGVQIHTTQNPNEEASDNSQFYFMPSSQTASINISDKVSTLEYNPSISLADSFKPMSEWYYADGTPETEADTPGETTQNTTTSSGSTGSTGSSTTGTTTSSGGTSNGTTSEELPSFVGSQNVIYFQIAGDNWQSEEELDKTKVNIEKVTVFDADMPNIDDIRAEMFDNNSATAIDDCVAIDYLRETTPTLFSNIVFRMDSSNTAFVKISNIDYAGKIVKLTHYVDDLTYVYNYQLDDEDTMYYYSIER